MVKKKSKIQKVIKTISKGAGKVSRKASGFKLPKLRKQPKRKESKTIRIGKPINVSSVLAVRIARRRQRGI